MLRSEEPPSGAFAGEPRRNRFDHAFTVYNGNLPDDQAPSARVALMVFNDAILRVAFAAGFDVIDLRSVCVEPSDYANPIEPSGSGGAKIARALAGALGFVARSGEPSRVYVGAGTLR